MEVKYFQILLLDVTFYLYRVEKGDTKCANKKKSEYKPGRRCNC